MSGWYYCPECGEGFAGPDAKVKRAFLPGIVDYYCPQCDRRLWIGGKQMILFGFLGWMICELFFEGPLAEKYGMVWFGSLMAMGLLRMQRQWQTWSAHFKQKMVEQADAGDSPAVGEESDAIVGEADDAADVEKTEA